MRDETGMPLRTALSDLGFFYALFTLIVSGPSVLSLLQTVFVEHRLIDALQWIVDGYNDIAAVVGGVLEPLLAPAIGWLERLLGVELTLQPYWRPLFILLSMFVIGWTRTAWRAGAHVSGAAFFAFGMVGALIGAAAAGIAPSTISGRGLLEVIIAGTPVLVLGLFLAAPLAAPLAVVNDALPEEGRPSLLWGMAIYCVLTVCVACLGAVAALLWAEAGQRDGAGVLGLGTVIVLVGAISFLVTTGPSRYALNAARLGLVLLGGFFTAGLILAADAVLKLLQA
jgi:hypothetical protein